MRLTEFLIVIVAALMFLIPQMNKENSGPKRQAQEEAPAEMLEEYNTYKVTYTVTRPQEEPIADIIWMKKAAEVAQRAGVPYFNILKQEFSKRFVRKYDRELSTVTGVIQLDNDPMRAEYDANEIESLVLTDYP